jgi:hypothetical protein
MGFNFERLRDKNRGAGGISSSPRGAAPKKTIAEIRNNNASEWAKHPERRPGTVRVLSREEIERLYGKR